MPTMSPIESEFATTEEAAAHDRWMRAKIEASLADTQPCIPHDVVMSEVDAMIARVEAARRT